MSTGTGTAEPINSSSSSTAPRELIPYIVEPHPLTGLTNGRLAMWLFIASEVMLFGALFSSYLLLRSGVPVWPPEGSEPLNLKLGTINTVVLLASSGAIGLAFRELKKGRLASFRMSMAGNVILGLLFLSIKGLEYSQKLHAGHLPSTNNYYGIYFTLTGLHALHIVGGLIINIYMMSFGSRLWKSSRGQLINRIGNAALYWHFVDVIWLCLFVTLYIF